MVRELALAVLLVACNGKQAPVAPERDDAAFRLDVTPPAGCVRATPCEVRIVLTALGGYKVNAEYPFKFVADAQPRVTFEGTGTFVPADLHTGTLTIALRAETAGTLHVTGTFKLSVCTDTNCKIEAPKLGFDVPVS